MEKQKGADLIFCDKQGCGVYILLIPYLLKPNNIPIILFIPYLLFFFSALRSPLSAIVILFIPDLLNP